MELDPGDHVLDLACGTGVNLPLLIEKVGPRGSIVALDQSAEMLAAARRRVFGHPGVELVEADATALELPRGSLNGALCTLGLSVITECRAAIRDVRRALTTEGRFVVVDATPYVGMFRPLNPVRDVLFKYGAAADAGKDIIGALRAEFEVVRIERLLAGSLFLACCEIGRDGR